MSDGRHDGWITLIGVAKMIKCAALVAIGTVALFLVHKDAAEELRHWAFALGLDPGNHLVHRALDHAGILDEKRLRELGVVTYVYAALFAVEGTGLLLHKRWGEYVTIAITGSFIPLEVYETVRHPHAGRIVAIVLNVAAVAYLVWRVRHRDQRLETGPGVAGATPGFTP